jgi:excisionase family DNA binding protein
MPQKLAYSIKEVRELIAISNSSIYKEIGEGRLRAVKRGNRTMILAADLQDWMSRWPVSL